MKKLLVLSMLSILLVGAGCSSSDSGTEKVDDVVEHGSWYLTVDDGSDWHAYGEYWKEGIDFVTPERTTKYGQNRVYLQNVAEPIKFKNATYKPDWQYYEGEDWVLFDIVAWPPNGTVPDDAWLEMYGDTEIWHRTQSILEIYYFRTDDALFEFQIRHGDEVEQDEVGAALAGLRSQ